ncbi:hypothetical protein HKX54_02995 [Sulfitobacter sp. M57]|uniref:hypothetical protein n=1 Tax=unclassified Sulfitobacter TaxID=196795 RepID=UPI0023E0D5E6|nr:MULTISPECIES: hypothetical protein [unclassified Sulfitobacter]MDF3413411.1 hypothetical protein [Sulfitobacter sp. KE5]MDF3421309.1 hypothetical protein [Sulfitobacter sp. KE43]MDF3431958.1 hypothetical protein [Sulfitobacter sp. KE42]MDF3457598.1 hypothetical protein [Sulfitobacter sp. S74]MDF3461500.1 hypothetical protein [Sulfitobacter sp. Ks18]
MANGPVFLERRSYRARRLMDAVRLLPLFGLALWMVPLMWPLPQAEDGGIAMSTALLYLFGVWLMLVAMRAVLWWKTARLRERETDAPE